MPLPLLLKEKINLRKILWAVGLQNTINIITKQNQLCNYNFFFLAPEWGCMILVKPVAIVSLGHQNWATKNNWHICPKVKFTHKIEWDSSSSMVILYMIMISCDFECKNNQDARLDINIILVWNLIDLYGYDFIVWKKSLGSNGTSDASLYH